MIKRKKLIEKKDKQEKTRKDIGDERETVFEEDKGREVHEATEEDRRRVLDEFLKWQEEKTVEFEKWQKEISETNKGTVKISIEGVGQQTGNRKVIAMEKQRDSEDEKTEEKDRREEIKTSSEGSGTWWQTGRQGQRTDMKGMWNQQRKEFVEKTVFQRTDSRALSVQGVKYPRSKVNDCRWNSRKDIQDGRDWCYYDMRNGSRF